jgi:hypothetical protein
MLRFDPSQQTTVRKPCNDKTTRAHVVRIAAQMAHVMEHDMPTCLHHPSCEVTIVGSKQGFHLSGVTVEDLNASRACPRGKHNVASCRYRRSSGSQSSD